MAPTALENITKLWTSHFSLKPRLLLNDLDFKRDMKALISHSLANDKMRRQMWDLVESLSNETNLNDVERFLNKSGDQYKLYSEIAANYVSFKKSFENTWLSTIHQWALCYRLSTSVNVIGVFNAFNRLKKFIGFKGTKNLSESFEQILKIGYDKCFLRSKRMFKGDQKFSRFMEEIAAKHNVARDILTKNTNQKCEISREEEGSANFRLKIDSKIVVVTEVKSKCSCKLLCAQCKDRICAHSYLCSCRDYLTSQVMCEHIHLAHMLINGLNNNEGDEEARTEEDLSNTESSEEGVFGKVQTFAGSDEEPGHYINIDAVLKAAGLFQHRRAVAGGDGLQAQQIVSITDADTQDVLYEHHEEENNSTEAIETIDLDGEEIREGNDSSCNNKEDEVTSVDKGVSIVEDSGEQLVEKDTTNATESTEESNLVNEPCNNEEQEGKEQEKNNEPAVMHNAQEASESVTESINTACESIPGEDSKKNKSLPSASAKDKKPQIVRRSTRNTTGSKDKKKHNGEGSNANLQHHLRKRKPQPIVVSPSKMKPRRK